MAITMAEARKRTSYPLAAQILQSSSETDDFYQFVSWVPVYGEADTHTFLRRKGKVPGRWRFPGETISQVDNPETTRVTSQLREMVNKTNTKDYVEKNMSNTFDQRMLNRIELVKDMSRDVARAAITGRYMDTCVIRSGGGLNAATLIKAGTVISPGPFYVEGMGDGMLQFTAGDGKLAFKAPNDANYGAGVVIAADGTYTLRSDNDAYFITITIGAVPAGTAHSELQFSSASKQPDGLINLVDSSMVIRPNDPVNGDAMTFDILDELQEQMDRMFVKEECAYVMHTRQFRALKARGRGLGGARIDIEIFGGRKIPVYEGVPILRTKYIPDVALSANAPRSHSVFCVNMNPEKGFFGLTAGGPEGTGMQSQTMREGTPVMGFKIRDLGMARDSNSDEEMIVWNGGFSLKAVQGVARRDGVFDK